MMDVMTDTKVGELSRLCKSRREELGLSMAQLSAASGDPQMSASWVTRLENGQLRDIPRRERLAYLAQGLKLSYQTVARAAARQFLDVEEEGAWSSDGTVRVVVDRMGEMSETGRQELAQIAEMFSRRPSSGSDT
jgi:transcriptional regulator with XRE-family HTH domain